MRRMLSALGAGLLLVHSDGSGRRLLLILVWPACKGLRCEPRRFLDGSGVMVLVPSKSGASGECLLTIGVRTNVGPFAGVGSTMPGQRAGVTERLLKELVNATPIP